MSPRNVTVGVESPTVLTVQWDSLRVDCSEVNGVIVEYKVQYVAQNSDVVHTKDQAAQQNVTRPKMSLTGLSPNTNYTIQVAAVNVEGDVGLLSAPLNIQTAQGMYNIRHISVTLLKCFLVFLFKWQYHLRVPETLKALQ